MYVLDDTQLYGHGIGVVYAQNAPKVGMQLVGGPEGIDPQASDYTALARAVAQTGADCVLISAASESHAVLVTEQVAGALPNALLFGRPYSAALADAASSSAPRNFSASSAAMQPIPAAVTAWRYTLSLTSPAA